MPSKPKKNSSREEENLRQMAVPTEVVSGVWNKFEQAMKNLDSSQQRIFGEYINGNSIKTIAESHQLTEGQVKDFIEQTKRELIQMLRTQCKVRQ